MADLPGLGQAIRSGDRDLAVALTAQAIAEGVTPQQILDAMTEAMDVVGDDFQANLIFVPEMLVAARAMREAMALLEPVLVQAGIQPEARAIIGTVRGDLHDIGKNLVGMMWRGANIEVIDLGTNVTAEQFVAARRDAPPGPGRPVGAAHDDDAVDGIDRRHAPQDRPRRRADHRRRRAGQRRVRVGDRRRRLCRRRGRRGRRRAAAARPRRRIRPSAGDGPGAAIATEVRRVAR